MQTLRLPEIAARGDKAARRRNGLAQLHQRRQKTGQRLAAAGRRNQQHRAPFPSLCQQVELMRARRPAAAREPPGEYLRQQRRGSGAVERGCGFHESILRHI